MQSAKMIVHWQKRSHNRSLSRLCSKVKECLSPQLNTKVG